MQRQLIPIWYVIGALLLLLLAQSVLTVGPSHNIKYNEFKSLLKDGMVSDLVVGQQTIRGMAQREGLSKVLAPESREFLGRDTRGAVPFTVVRVEDPQLIPELEREGIAFRGEINSNWLPTLLSWIIPVAIFLIAWSYLFNKVGGGAGGGGLMQIGKSRAKAYIEKRTGVTFADVEGIDEAEEELIEVVEYLKTPQKYQRLGGRIPKGVLLVGPPGTGKTLLARAVAGEAGVPFFSITGSEFVEMFVGVGAARVRDLFSQAAEHAPSIVFIDELDALGKARGMNPLAGHDEREQTLNQLLAEMDGFDSNKGVIIMAATNRPEILDPALLRPGRFDRQVLVDRPDIRGREKILRLHAKKIKLAPDVELGVIAARTPGFVGADLANIVNEAALLAARTGDNAVGMRHFNEAIERVVAGLQKKSRVMNAREKKTVAYHESGHALMAELIPEADPVTKVSIIPRGIAALGYTQQFPTEDRYLMTRSELLARIHVLLGGRVAEEMIFEDVSTGAQNDLQRATEIARTMITQFGMSERLGLVSLEGPRTPLFLPIPSQGPKDYSEETARLIDEEIQKILSGAHAKVKETLFSHRSELEKLAQLLLDKEVVERPEIQAILKVRSLEAVKASREKKVSRGAASQDEPAQRKT